MILLNNHLGHCIRILHWCTDQAMTAALETMDLTAAQGHIMGYLSHRKEPPCPRDLETAFHLSHPTVSGLLSRLEQKGFVALLPDENDRRCKRIRVLPRGEECHQKIHEAISQTEAQLVRHFSESEQEQFRQLLSRAIANMGPNPCHPISKEETTK